MLTITINAYKKIKSTEKIPKQWNEPTGTSDVLDDVGRARESKIWCECAAPVSELTAVLTLPFDPRIGRPVLLPVNPDPVVPIRTRPGGSLLK